MEFSKHRIIIISFIIGLMFANIYLFAQTVSLSDSIGTIEKKTIGLRQENQLLQEKYYTLNSIQHLEKVADYLGFTESAKSLSLQQLNFAMR